MSGIDTWQREVPSGWTVRPLRSVAEYAVSNVDKILSEEELPVRLCNYTDVYNNETIHLGMEFMAGTATQAEIEKFHLLTDDVVITKDSESWDDIAIPALVTETADDVVCGYHLAMIRPDPEKLEGAFLFRCLQSKTLRVQLELAANGITRFGIPKNAIGSMALPVPPTSIQRAIARFLDRETAEIDALIATKQRLLDLLAEKRRAIVAEAVMRGLAPSAPLRPSGIDWLGDIPAHWEVRRVATLFTQRDERSQPELPLLEVSINSGVIVREFSNDKIEGTASDFNTYKVARRGHIAFNKMRMWQGAAGVAPVDGLVSPDYTVAEAASCLRPEYAGLLFRTDSFSAECGRNSQGITWDRLRLYWDGFRDIFMPLPPLAEQDAILEAVQAETAKIDRLRAATEHSIRLLKERRGALIAAAVTGQIDIPEAA
jgi:type I restriction enzyme S subunit